MNLRSYAIMVFLCDGDGDGDAGDPDEDSGVEPDAGPALNVVYASFNGTLVPTSCDD